MFIKELEVKPPPVPEELPHQESEQALLLFSGKPHGNARVRLDLIFVACFEPEKFPQLQALADHECRILLKRLELGHVTNSSMITLPKLELLTSKDDPKHTPLLVLVAQRAPFPQKYLASVPAHLREHAAIRGERGAHLAIHSSTPILFFGIGRGKDFTAQEASEWGENAGRLLRAHALPEAHTIFPEDLKDTDSALCFIKGIALANYEFDDLKSKASDSKDKAPKKSLLAKISFSGHAATLLKKSDLAKASAIASGVSFARDLTELPPNVASPEGIVSRFKKAVQKGTLEIEVWDEKKIAKEGMGLLKAVAKGSIEPARFLIVRYGKDIPLKGKPHLFLVGKGVTFDTGGVNLKISGWTDLLWMKKDMGGSAAVLGAMLAIGDLKPGIPVTAVTPLTFNSMGSSSTLPGEVVRAYSGKTVEIMNTDAEGRLILADALHYAVKTGATHIVDVATLTGACQVALGDVHSGAFTNSPDFAHSVIDASTAAGEPAWLMPMSPRYGEELRSKVADLSNMGKSRNGGATIGAKFLERFVDQTPWCHLDIAGAVDLTSAAGGDVPVPAAGRMVHALVELTERMAKNPKR